MSFNDYLYKEHLLEKNIFLNIQTINFENENEWYWEFQDVIYEENKDVLRFYE